MTMAEPADRNTDATQTLSGTTNSTAAVNQTEKDSVPFPSNDRDDHGFRRIVRNFTPSSVALKAKITPSCGF